MSIEPFDSFLYRYRTEKKYTQKDINDALERQAKELQVNRVVRLWY